ncbi:syntaxin-22 [Physcomitrium patens]|uniref:t-SNARE coiled-coil homology domain-containing protein n=1 Tax=Physcomitrium patens TaxID=3218 RepID=A9S759_PHYPA|nr:syntaxin-22-like [Physcomitrium patens]XP_024377266.1 syntaxin-22-like [Physcomitrium patens]PNR53107.1 hypothetical protein PHYPA_009482 [Physcomitrium patens]|eukprot:XP_024377265.1 syntaxin-22-like [Physcomitrella patens]
MSFLDIEAGGMPPGRRQQDSTQALASGVFQINTAVSSFKRLVSSLGTAKDTPALRDKLHKTRQHIGQLAKETGAKLKTASEHDHNRPVHGNKKLSDAKLAKDFQAVLVEFQNAQKIAQEREKLYAPFVPEAALPTSQYSGEMKSAPEENQDQRAFYAAQRSQDFIQLENETVFNEAVIEEREQGIREIHQQIGEVNEIFKDLAVLVHDQGYMIEDIDANVQGAEAATEQANRQLAKAAKSQKSGTTMTCLILVIVAMAVLVLLLFLTR